MANNKRQGTVDAINKFYQRELDKDKPKEPRAANKRPEKDVEKECLKWMREKGWSVQIFEAKATYNPEVGRWMQQGMKAGTCDCMGNTDDGQAVAIEFKAKGKLSTFNKESNYRQRKFLTDKINTNTFACVVDSPDRLADIYMNWIKIKSSDSGAARTYLISMLPSGGGKTGLKDEKLFDDE